MVSAKELFDSLRKSGAEAGSAADYKQKNL
jgi:hypothetical protein